MPEKEIINFLMHVMDSIIIYDSEEKEETDVGFEEFVNDSFSLAIYSIIAYATIRKVIVEKGYSVDQTKEVINLLEHTELSNLVKDFNEEFDTL